MRSTRRTWHQTQSYKSVTIPINHHKSQQISINRQRSRLVAHVKMTTNTLNCISRTTTDGRTTTDQPMKPTLHLDQHVVVANKGWHRLLSGNQRTRRTVYNNSQTQNKLPGLLFVLVLHGGAKLALETGLMDLQPIETKHDVNSRSVIG